MKTIVSGSFILENSMYSSSKTYSFRDDPSCEYKVGLITVRTAHAKDICRRHMSLYVTHVATKAQQ